MAVAEVPSDLIKKAIAGDVTAQHGVASCYWRGIDVAEDKNEAVKWFRLAAAQGNAVAQYMTAYAYKTGLGVEKDINEALAWYRKAALQGDAESQFALGWLIAEEDPGAQKDFAEAIRWYRLAAEQGHAKACVAIAFMYAQGRGVSKDYVGAHVWASVGDSLGDPHGAQLREAVGKLLTAEQIAEAGKLARARLANLPEKPRLARE